MTNYHLMQGDCIKKLQSVPDNKADAVVTDPPYGLAFMGQTWDDFEPKELQEFTQEWAEECLRVLKPGGHLLSFGGTRTFHRIASGIEDAGFEIRDCLSWHYGSGFPKSHDISKAIDKMEGVEREVLEVEEKTNPATQGRYGDYGDDGVVERTAPATDEAKKWDGYGTALKPSWEPIILARAPLSEDTIAENVLKHGTGALNIDGCRIGKDIDTSGKGGEGSKGIYDKGYGKKEDGRMRGSKTGGRFPANSALSHSKYCIEEDGEWDCPPCCPIAMLDEQSGELSTGDIQEHHSNSAATGNTYGNYNERNNATWSGDTGGASRYFYTSKAQTSEREMGMDGEKCSHPTVKPLDLIRWLIKLVTPIYEDKKSIVLDPFTGSGTTGIAVSQLRGKIDANLKFLGVEKEEEYHEVAYQRIRWAANENWAKHFALQEWQEVKSVGKKTAVDLYEKLGEIDRADLDQLEEIEGIGEKTANSIRGQVN